MFIEIRFLQTRYQLKKKLLFSEIKDTQFRESSPLHRKTDSETSRTYNPRITSVHFKPEFIGCHLNIWLKMAHTRLTKGIPTSKIPAMYITMADSGEVGSTTSAIGKREMRAAPPPTATAIAANNSATNTTPNTNSIGLQIMANITRQISTANRLPSPAYLPTSARKYGACPTSYNHSPHWQPSRSHPSPSFRYSLP